ncbi:condensation domain-containing protein [Kribbella sp. NPDC050820]|uniref:condensation domain-containing protein n=1 Tax=Kribbella sp. NPDC050820 TaxID=3155408 RepID=UPI0033DF426C
MHGAATTEIAVPASPAQRKFWQLHREHPRTNADNLVGSLELPDAADLSIVCAAMKAVIRRHEVLRTKFDLVGGTLVQFIAPEVPFEAAEIRLGGTPDHVAPDAHQTDLLRDMLDRPFDFGRAPAVRAALVCFTGSATRIAVIVTNHAIADGWSFGLVQHEFRDVVDALCRGTEPRLQPVKQFRQVAAERSPERPDIARQLAYWTNQLAGVRTTLPVRTRQDRAKVSREDLRDQPLALDGGSWDQLVRMQRSVRASLPMLYTSALAASLIARPSQELVIGTVYSSRRPVENEHVVGLLVNVLPLRISVDRSTTVRGLIDRVRQVTLEAYAHADVPMDHVTSSLGFGRPVLGGGPPLWEAAINITPGPATPSMKQVSSGFSQWLWSIRSRPSMECWDGRILELITLGSLPHQGVIRYNSAILPPQQGALVATKIITFLRELPANLDQPVNRLFSVGA